MKVKMQEYDVSQQSLVLEDLIVQHPVELMLFSRLKKSLSGIWITWVWEVVGLSQNDPEKLPLNYQLLSSHQTCSQGKVPAVKN